MSNCTHCNLALNRSQYNVAHTLKSCPNCSKNNGGEHVYYDYPSEFGVTDLRATATVPDGAQSHCTACRAYKTPTAPATLCHSL